MKTFIAAAMLLASITSAHAAPKGEWFLILDAWHCSTRSCADDGSYEDFVVKETFATRKQCLARGRYLIQLAAYIFSPRDVDEDYRATKDELTLGARILS